MTLDEFREKITSPSITDPATIRGILKGLYTVPMTQMYNSSISIKQSGEPYRAFAKRKICERMGIPEDDPAVKNFAGLVREIHRFSRSNDMTDYQTRFKYMDELMYLAFVHIGFVEREE